LRVTLGMMSDHVRSSLMTSSERLLDAQEQAASGKRIRRPSDDVPGTGRSLNLRSALASLEQYGDNAAIAKTQLSVTTSTLDSVIRELQEVRRLAVQAANSSLDEAALGGIASQLDSISTELAGLANTQSLGKYIFSGSMTNTATLAPSASGDPPYDYQGDSAQFQIQVSQGVRITANVTGDVVFNLNGAGVPGSSDVFACIKALKENVLAGDTAAISAQIAEIDANLGNVNAVRSQVGGRLNRLEAAEQSLLDANVRVATLLSETEDVDLAEATIALRTQEIVYQAALSAASRILEISLGNYLR